MRACPRFLLTYVGRYLLGDGVASDHLEARLWCFECLCPPCASIMPPSFRFQKARKLDEDAELPCFLALCVELCDALFVFVFSKQLVGP